MNKILVFSIFVSRNGSTVSQCVFEIKFSRTFDPFRLKVGLGQTTLTDGKDGSPAFANCFTVKCDANRFKMIIEVVKTCPQFENYIGQMLQNSLRVL